MNFIVNELLIFKLLSVWTYLDKIDLFTANAAFSLTCRISTRNSSTDYDFLLWFHLKWQLIDALCIYSNASIDVIRLTSIKRWLYTITLPSQVSLKMITVTYASVDTNCNLHI